MSVHEKLERPKLQLHHRPVEIERKFLVANDEWRQSALGSVSIRDGLIAVYQGRKVHVRVWGDTATVAIKGPRIGIVRPEFEYELPIADAERMLATLCHDDTLEKQRFFVEDAGATWYVDVYGGLLEGVIIAEIELKQESQELTLPHWIGKEVTGDPFYNEIKFAAPPELLLRLQHLFSAKAIRTAKPKSMVSVYFGYRQAQIAQEWPDLARTPRWRATLADRQSGKQSGGNN